MVEADARDVIDDSVGRISRAMRHAWRQREIAQADNAATQMRPWFYENYVRHRAAGIDRGVAALLANQSMAWAEERRASWQLMRDLCWRLRHGSEFPRLSATQSHTIRVAIRAELRRLVLSAQRHGTWPSEAQQAAE
jgi:hypothetical protein